ncbi:hypothetical protein BJX64DRAFT_207999 [Aspergillus heterothallicus]
MRMSFEQPFGQGALSYSHTVSASTIKTAEDTTNTDEKPPKLESPLNRTRIRDAISSKWTFATSHLRRLGNPNNIPLPFTPRSLSPGREWIKGVLLCTWTCALILLINITLTAIAVGLTYSNPANREGNFERGVIYEGSCALIDDWKIGLHFLINVLSTGLLAVSNYVMQCLCAPSREGVDRAHARGSWLDVGTLSLRNFGEMDWVRRGVWIVLFVSSAPVHMLFNSAVFSSMTTSDYQFAVVPTDLAPDEALVDERDAFKFRNVTGFDADEVRDDYLSGGLQEISLDDCYDKVDSGVGSQIGLILIVTDREFSYERSNWLERTNTTDHSEVWEYRYTGSRYTTSLARSLTEGYSVSPQHWNYPVWSFRNTTGGNGSSDEWYDYRDLYRNQYDFGKSISTDINMLYNYIYIHNPEGPEIQNLLDTSPIWHNATWAQQLELRIDTPRERGVSLTSGGPASVKPSHCLVKKIDEDCELYMSVPICLAVIACNVIKLVCMFMASRMPQKEILLTVGDAVASFLDRPDSTTDDKEWSNVGDLLAANGHNGVTSDTGVSFISRLAGHGARFRGPHSGLHPKNKRLYHSVSWRRWTATVLCILTCTIATIYGYTKAAQSIGTPLGASLGVGRQTLGDAILLYSESITSLLLLCNAPQLALSALYYLCNSTLSTMLAASEYNAFSHTRKPLRVSWPRGLQRSTYYLSIPWRFGIPMLAISTTLHWLLSQTFFLVLIDQRTPQQEILSDATVGQVGFSLFGLFLTLVIGALAVLGFAVFAVLPLKGAMPLAGSCSLAISAACHPPRDDGDASLKALMWGEVVARVGGRDGDDEPAIQFANAVVAQEARSGHCTFTSKDVISPGL